MKVATLLTCLVVAAAAGAQEKSAQRVDQEQFLRDLAFSHAVLSRARLNPPKRRDTPLRELNLTDEEIREIQAATKSYLPSDYLNISPVVTGCICEDGPDCTEQVYVLADAGTTAKGLQLSRIKNAWTVSVLQQWWLDFGRLEQRSAKMDYLEFQRELITLARQYPMCPKPDKPEAAPKTAKASSAPK